MKTQKVFPSSKLSPTEYIAGVGAEGAELPEDQAQALLDAGLAVKTKPSKPAEPAQEPEE